MQNLKKICLCALLALALLSGCGSGGDAPGSSAEEWLEASSAEVEEQQPEQETLREEVPPEQETEQKLPQEEKETSPKQTEQAAVPEAEKPEKEENGEESGAEPTCTISISCATILDNLDRCDENKVELVPENGWILRPTEVVFYEEESVFNVLQRVCKQNKIHLEYAATPLYNSAYIEGIGNLYEFDVGELSGWMYSVNGAFPNFGSSRYVVQPGDLICWVYTCDLGTDVGGANAEQKDE